MHRIYIALATAAGMSGCAVPAPTDAGLCLALAPAMAALRRGLEAHPETPGPVGEPGADAVIGFEAGCRYAAVWRRSSRSWSAVI